MYCRTVFVRLTLNCTSFHFTDFVQPFTIRRILSLIVRCYPCVIILLSHSHCPYTPSLYYDCGPKSVSVYSRTLRNLLTKPESGSAGGCWHLQLLGFLSCTIQSSFPSQCIARQGLYIPDLRVTCLVFCFGKVCSTTGA